MLIPQGSFSHKSCAAEEAGERSCRGPLTVWYWSFKECLSSPSIVQRTATTPEGRCTNEDTPPQVLELGCSDGRWCFKLKTENPGWIVEGLDDTDRWSYVERDTAYRFVSIGTLQGFADVFRDFLSPKPMLSEEGDYFGNIGQKYPMFMRRNLNHLLRHEKPLQKNSYGLIRGREAFDRVQNYKMFIEDLRQ